MQQLWRMAFTMVIVALATGFVPGRNPSSPPSDTPTEHDPEKMFQRARTQLIALEAEHAVLKGVSAVKPEIEHDANGRLKSARLLFERNVKPVGKEVEARDKSRPFLYVSVQIWSPAGSSQQPPANLYTFQWKGQTYNMWIRVFGSDPDLIRKLRAAVDPWRAEPPEPDRPKNPTLRLRTSPTLKAYRQGQPLVFEGLAAVPIHRPGPEHFKLTRVKDEQRIGCRVAYDRDKVETRRPEQERVTPPQQKVHVYNSLFRGTRLLLYDGSFDAKDPMEQAGVLVLYGCPKLEAGVRYRLTWACWPVGASKAVEVACDFQMEQHPENGAVPLHKNLFGQTQDTTIVGDPSPCGFETLHVPVGTDLLDTYPRSDAFTANVAWHKQVGENEIRMSWFLRGDPGIAMACTADLSSSRVTTSREVHNHASQSTKTRELSHAQVETLRMLARNLPASAKPPKLNNLILVSVSEKGKVRTYLYERSAPPGDIIRLYDVTGAYLGTE